MKFHNFLKESSTKNKFFLISVSKFWWNTVSTFLLNLCKIFSIFAWLCSKNWETCLHIIRKYCSNFSCVLHCIVEVLCSVFFLHNIIDLLVKKRTIQKNGRIHFLGDFICFGAFLFNEKSKFVFHTSRRYVFWFQKYKRLRLW